MLSNSQVDELERLIVFSTMDNLPLVLSRAIPLLFSELRLVRATLDSKVGDFLGGIGEQREEVAAATGEAGLRGRAESLAARPEVQVGRQPEGHQVVADGNAAEDGARDSGKRKRGRPKKIASPSQMDTGASQPQMGGPVGTEARVPDILGISPSPRLKGDH